MKTVDIPRAAREAVAANANRPATTVVHDSPDARLIVFRIAAGQAVPPHRNASAVTLAVISGRGFIRGGEEEQAVAPAEIVVFEPNELHGMRAELEELVLLATITPRPGARSDVAPQPVAVARGTAVATGGEE
jgi:quercetin dioxygenase-like cupin family protein